MVILWLLPGLLLFLMGIKNLASATPDFNSIKTGKDTAKDLLWVFTIGIIMTALTQSSSAIGVIVLVFLDRRKISFKQAGFFLVGGNIGTTISGQIFTLPTEKLIIPLLIVSLICYIIGKRYNIFAEISRYLMSVMLIFLGLEIISSVTLYYREEFALALQRFDSIYQAFIIGIILTAVSQSSSLIIGILVVLASKSIITVEYAVAAVLGLNIGTATTLLFACIGLNRDGKLGAVFQVVYNCICALLIFLVFPGYMSFLNIYAQNPSQIVANAHTFFNIGGALTLIFTWNFIEWLVYWIVGTNFKSEQ